MNKKVINQILGIGLVLLLIGAMFGSLPSDVKADSAPTLEWDKTFGGLQSDEGYSVQQTSDGGYILVARTANYVQDGEVIHVVGSFVWLIKTDASGNMSWNKKFGGAAYDGGNSVQQTSDGGYIIVGDNGQGGQYVWLIKTDASGNMSWNKKFGGTNSSGNSVQQTLDGGYILVGNNFGGLGVSDVWLIKTDASGNMVWDKTFGGTNEDWGQSVQQTSDGGYIITGSTRSYGLGNFDVWLIKTDANGNKIWDKTFGGIDRDEGHSVQQTSDDGYIIAGYTSSYGAGSADHWMIKTDASGNKLWDKTFGGTDFDECYSVQQTSDSGYILAGRTRSYGAGNDDIWLIKADASGSMLWHRLYGGANNDDARCVQQTMDGGYILAGRTCSYGAGSSDVWLIKVSAELLAVLESIAASPTSVTLPVGGIQQLTITATYSDNSTADVTATSTYASSDTSVATISTGGLITQVAAGSATITVSYTEGGITKTTTVPVTIKPPLVSLAASPTSVSMAIGGTQQLTVTMTYSDNSTADVTATSTYASSDTSVATASSGGLITGKATGSAAISVSYTEGGITRTTTVPVTVTPPDTATATATRAIATPTLAPGGTTEITVTFTSLLTETKSFALDEDIPSGWTLTRVSDDASAFQAFTNTWIWFSVGAGATKTVTYSLTAPSDATEGDYSISGIVTAAGVENIVGGDITITVRLFDILAYYRAYSGDPNVVETEDLLKAADDWASGAIPEGFTEFITTKQLLQLADEWAAG